MGPSKGSVRIKKKRSLRSLNEVASTSAFTSHTSDGVAAPLTRHNHVDREDLTPPYTEENQSDSDSFDHLIEGHKMGHSKGSVRIKKKRSLRTFNKVASTSAFTSHTSDGVAAPLTRHNHVDREDLTPPYAEENQRGSNSFDYLIREEAAGDAQLSPNASQADATPRDEQPNFGANQSAFASDPLTEFVLPPNQRRSYRESRSKYRRPFDHGTRGLSVEVGDANCPNQDNNVTSSNLPPEDTETVETTGASFTSKKGTRGINLPGSCRPKHGDHPFKLLWVNNAPVGENAVKFGLYVSEEAKIYHRYPIHKEWDKEQTRHAFLVYESAQQKDYLFIGEEDPNPEYDGERIPLNELNLKKWIKEAINYAKNDWRHTIKVDYYNHWVKADDKQRAAIVNSLPCRIPKDQWPLICEYFASPKKMVEAERNTKNRNCKNKLKAPGTQGSITMANAQYRLKKKHGNNYNGLLGWLDTHKPVDDSSRTYIEKVQDAAQDLPLTHETDVSIISPILDSLSGHHGGYERGMGRGHKRKYMIDDSLGSNVISRRE